MKRFREIVIGSRGQPFDDFLFIGVAGKEDDVRVGLLEVPAYALAEFNAAKCRAYSSR
jgi:hypothetical protein